MAPVGHVEASLFHLTAVCPYAVALQPRAWFAAGEGFWGTENVL